jgi:hypothetical protein
MDYFFAGTDNRTQKEKKPSHSDHKEHLITILNIVDHRSLAQGTLMGDKSVDDYKIQYCANLIDSWGHTLVKLQTDGEPAMKSLAEAIKRFRSHGTIIQGSPEYSHQSAGTAERTNGLAAGLLRTYRMALEHKLGKEIRPNHPIMPFLVMSVGWFITRFQTREHGGSSFKYLHGKEYGGEVAEMGEQLWYRISARVESGQGKYEARFAKGIWVGKSEFDDSHLVVDLVRGLQKVRTVRRMPQEFRWNAELLEIIEVSPWNPKTKAVEGAKYRSLYITERMIDTHGPTDRCTKCSTGKGQHSADCRQRFEQIQADLLIASEEEEQK